MKTIAILVIAAGSLPLAACATSGADSQTQPKYCYQTPHKAPYRVRVPCPNSDATARPSSNLGVPAATVDQQT